MTYGGIIVTEIAQGTPVRGGGSRRRWRARPARALSPADRRRILGSLYPAPGERTAWWTRFAVMLVLSTIVAVIGLATNSPALVIGAMLLAPLMTPIMGLAGAVVMAWPRRMGECFLAILGGIAAAVVLSWLLTMLLPASATTVTDEILARTSPDVQALWVALAAGAAGAYTIARDRTASALPGAAIGVALLPPLATVGFCFAVRRFDLAGGAFLLFVANLVAIVLSGITVFAVTGFAPRGRIAAARPGVLAGIVVTVLATVGIAGLLVQRTLEATTRAQHVQAVNRAVLDWLRGDSGLDLVDVETEANLATVTVVGPKAPPPSDGLARALVGELGPDAAVQVRWLQQNETVASARPVARPSGPAGVDVARVRPLVESWLADDEAGGMTVTGITVAGETLSIELVGMNPPPPAQLLAEAVSSDVGRDIKVTVSWTQGFYQTSGGQAPASRGDERLLARAAAEQWVQGHPGLDVPGLDVLRVDVDGDAVTVDLAGTGRTAPGTAGLAQAIEARLGRPLGVTVRYLRLDVLSGPASAAPSTGPSPRSAGPSTARSTAPSTASPAAAAASPRS